MVELSFNIDYELIGKTLSGQASEAEIEVLNSWLEASSEARDIYSELEKIWVKEYFFNEETEYGPQAEVKDKIWNIVFEKQERKE